MRRVDLVSLAWSSSLPNSNCMHAHACANAEMQSGVQHVDSGHVNTAMDTELRMVVRVLPSLDISLPPWLV